MDGFTDHEEQVTGFMNSRKKNTHQEKVLSSSSSEVRRCMILFKGLLNN